MLRQNTLGYPIGRGVFLDVGQLYRIVPWRAFNKDCLGQRVYEGVRGSNKKKKVCTTKPLKIMWLNAGVQPGFGHTAVVAFLSSDTVELDPRTWY